MGIYHELFLTRIRNGDGIYGLIGGDDFLRRAAAAETSTPIQYGEEDTDNE